MRNCWPKLSSVSSKLVQGGQFLKVCCSLYGFYIEWRFSLDLVFSLVVFAQGTCIWNWD